jgi:response regulator RpfG family c-di-GMP phosphodiesterase
MQDAAIAALRSAAGTQFDPAVVEAFVEELHAVAGEGELAQLQVYRQTIETVRAGR